MLLLSIAPASNAQNTTLQQLTSGQHFALLRHALAPGFGDPEHFTLNDCSTQRNLSNAGRRQAERIGARLRAIGITSARVVSSEWCRCLDTARLLGLGTVQRLPVLNSFFAHPTKRESQTAALTTWLATQSLQPPLIIVTHQVNIAALVGQGAQSGELLIVDMETGGKFQVVATIPTEVSQTD